MEVIKRNGQKEELNMEKIRKFVERACEKEEHVEKVIESLKPQLRDGMTTKEIVRAIIQTMVEKISVEEPFWKFAAAKALLFDTYKEASINRGDGIIGYGNFYKLIKRLVDEGRYNKRLLEEYTKEEIEELGKYIKPERDFLLDYMGLRHLMSRYTVRGKDNEILELPQEAFMTVAMYIALNESKEKRVEMAKKFYDNLSRLVKTAATPTLKNARTPFPQLSSCFIDTVEDSLWGIYNTNTAFANVSKLGGGMGIYMGKIRARGSDIRGVKGAAAGIIPWARVYNDTAVAVDQLNTRKGAVTLYLDVWHADIFEFLQLKTNNGDERMKAHDVFLGVCIPDLFMKQLEKRGEWYLFDPHQIRQIMGWSLEDFYDDEENGEFTKRYWECVNHPQIEKKKVKAMEIMKAIMKSAWETGTPFIFFRDTANRFNPNKHAGMVYCSNLCVTGDTRLLTDKGYKKVRDLYESQEEIKVIIDNRTKNFEADNYGTSVVDAIPVQLTARNADVYKVTTKQGYEIKATDWHKMYVLRDGKVVKIPLKELVVGDKILVQSGPSEGFGTFHDPELAYIAGLIAADGCIHDGVAIIYLYEDKKQIKEKVEQCVANVLERYIDRDIKHNANMAPKFNKNDNRYTLTSHLLGYVLNKFGINKETKKTVPEFVWSGDKETQAAYLSGIYQMDGTVNASEKYKACSIELVQNSLDFLKEIQILLLNFGVYTTIYKSSEGGMSTLPDGKGGVKQYVTKEAHKLSIQDRQSRDNFISHVELKEQDMVKLNEFNKTLKPKSREPKHKFTADVVSIEYIGKEDVYDTTQPDYNSLIFNGIVTGNCTEIIQNMSPTELIEQRITNENGETIIVYKQKPGDFVVCNLSSINLGRIETLEEMEQVITTTMRFLDNVIDLNLYPVPQAEVTNKKYRAVGLGVHGYHQRLAKDKIKWESEEHLKRAEELFEWIAFFAIKASMELAKERGPYPLFEGSEWHTGKFFERRNLKTRPGGPDWDWLKEEVRKHGVRNAYMIAVAPTGSTSIIAGSTPSTDPIFAKFWIEEKKGSIIPNVVPDLNQETFWYYKEAHNIAQEWSVRAAGVRQRFIDQAGSFNLYVNPREYSGPEGTKRFFNLYVLAWKEGLKTIYYVRNQNLQVEECVSCSS